MSVGGLMSMFFVVIVSFKRPGDIYHGQEGENKGLYETSENNEHLHRPGKGKENLQAQQHQNAEHQFLSRNVSEKAQSER